MNTYDYIKEKIGEMKKQYPSLRSRTDDYVFSVLCVKAYFYKNPKQGLNESGFAEMIVDSPNDGGADILLSDPNPETSDLIIGQSKFCKSISTEEVLNAVRKMADFYNDMTAGHYERVNKRVRSRFVELEDEIDDESKIRFFFYTSAPQKKINTERIKEKFREQFVCPDNIELFLLFAADIKKEIGIADSWKPSVESGEVKIDKAKNYLLYGENAVVVNVSAFSIKRLYTLNGTNLLSLNLRYHIVERKRDGVDNAIKNTIEDNPASFWLKNNGITIICDSFEIDGNVVRLRNFSIVNGGQTTYQIHKSDKINASNDLWLPCKIIKNTGKTEDEKNSFSLAIAQAANAQKPITQDDLRANAPEQISFEKKMKSVGVFYKTKRGQEVPQEYRIAYRNTNLSGVGKLCMAGIFQMPCVGRNSKNAFHKVRYYEYIFNKNQEQVARICKELLYTDYYFKKTFRHKFAKDNDQEEDGETIIIPFANKARTLCIAFTALAARYYQGNITEQDLKIIFAAATSDSVTDDLNKAVRDLGEIQSLFPKKLSENMDLYDAALDKLFTAIIEAGISSYSGAHDANPALTENSFLQSDKNYYRILKSHWKQLKRTIHEVFADV